MNQSELEANTCSRRQARENACRQVTIGFDFTSDWSRKWREIFFSQSQTVAMQNQNNCVITFDTELKIALKCEKCVKMQSCIYCISLFFHSGINISLNCQHSRLLASALRKPSSRLEEFPSTGQQFLASCLFCVLLAYRPAVDTAVT